MESFELHFGLILNGKRMNQKAKPHKWSLVVGDQNGIQVCLFVSEEFDHNDLTLIAFYYGKILYAIFCAFNPNKSRSDSIHITYDFYNNDNTSPKTNHSPTAANHAKAKTNHNDYEASSPGLVNNSISFAWLYLILTSFTITLFSKIL